jgi:hypothetical protein
MDDGSSFKWLLHAVSRNKLHKSPSLAGSTFKSLLLMFKSCDSEGPSNNANPGPCAAEKPTYH